MQVYPTYDQLRRTGHSLIAVYFRSANNRQHMGRQLSQQRRFNADILPNLPPSALRHHPWVLASHSELPVTGTRPTKTTSTALELEEAHHYTTTSTTSTIPKQPSPH